MVKDRVRKQHRLSHAEQKEKWEEGQAPKTSFQIKLKTIRERCNSPMAVNYDCYGAKGIKCFLSIKDLIFLWRRDKAWELKKASIDRIDPDGNYQLDNCIFIEQRENSGKHRRSSVVRKLTELDVKIIKQLLKNGGVQTRIAKKFNVSDSMINYISTGKCWNHI